MATVSLFSYIVAITVFFSYAGADCPAEKNETWSYNAKLKNGPEYWGETYPNCYGKMQSPINIQTSDVKKDDSLGNLQMNNYDTPVTKFKLENNGHSVKVVPVDDVIRSVIVDGDTYTLDHLHFHWGDKYYRGSEHTINNKQYRMEGHFVHFNKDRKIAVVGVFFEDIILDPTSLEMSKITKNLKRVLYKGDTAQVANTNLRLNRFVKNNCPFYRYSGSLTTPGCDEGVTWTLCKDTRRILPSQILEFRRLYSTEKNDNENIEGCKITNNFRPTQPLNDRTVTSNV